MVLPLLNPKCVAPQQCSDEFAVSVTLAMASILTPEQSANIMRLAAAGYFGPSEPDEVYDPHSHMSALIYIKGSPEHMRAWRVLWETHYQLCNPEG